MANPTIVKGDTIAAAWAQLAPAVEFGGVARDTGYEVSLQNAKDAETAVDEAEALVVDKREARDAALAILAAQTKLVVNAVKGSPAHGPDSALYEAMGFVPDSKRKSGLSRKTTGSAPAPTP